MTLTLTKTIFDRVTATEQMTAASTTITQPLANTIKPSSTLTNPSFSSGRSSLESPTKLSQPDFFISSAVFDIPVFSGYPNGHNHNHHSDVPAIYMNSEPVELLDEFIITNSDEDDDIVNEITMKKVYIFWINIL